MSSTASPAADRAKPRSCPGEVLSPVCAANATRNAQATRWRAARWRRARAALWQLLERHVDRGDRVAVIGAGNGDDIPLRRLRHRAGHIDLIDLDAAALSRARRRLITPPRPSDIDTIVQDVTFGRADAIAKAARNGHAPPPPRSTPGPVSDPYDVVVADLLFTQLLYPALLDAHLPAAIIDDTLRSHGQPLTDAVVAWLHTNAPDGLVIHLHDLLGWGAGHPQPFPLSDVLALADHDIYAALRLAQTGHRPSGCDPRPACAALGATIIDTALWHWPFTPSVDYLICATVAHT